MQCPLKSSSLKALCQKTKCYKRYIKKFEHVLTSVCKRICVCSGLNRDFIILYCILHHYMLFVLSRPLEKNVGQNRRNFENIKSAD